MPAHKNQDCANEFEHLSMLSSWGERHVGWGWKGGGITSPPHSRKGPLRIVLKAVGLMIFRLKLCTRASNEFQPIRIKPKQLD